MIKTVMRFVFAASALTGTVQAQPPVNVPATAIVAYGDLDLSRAAGQAALFGRVHRAADRLCATGMRGIGPAMAQRRCLGNVLAQAHPQVDRAIALYGDRQFAGRATLAVASR